MLRELVEKKEPIELTFCLNDATQLQKVLHRVIGNRPKGALDQEDKIDVAGAVEVQYLAEAFERSLITELRETNTYFVSSVGIFSTSALLTKAEEMFGEHRNLMPGMTVAVIQEAGKCLAFSLGSAAAFHLFGALESVLKEYYDRLSGGKAPPKNPSMGAYINELAEVTGVDQKLIAALRQVKDLHRNPAIHFDTILDDGPGVDTRRDDSQRDLYNAGCCIETALCEIGREQGLARQEKAFPARGIKTADPFASCYHWRGFWGV